MFVCLCVRELPIAFCHLLLLNLFRCRRTDTCVWLCYRLAAITAHHRGRQRQTEGERERVRESHLSARMSERTYVSHLVSTLRSRCSTEQARAHPPLCDWRSARRQSTAPSTTEPFGWIVGRQTGPASHKLVRVRMRAPSYQINLDATI